MFKPLAIVLAAGLCCAPCLAEPQLWVINRARGNAATDTRFDQTVTYGMIWGMGYSVLNPSTTGIPVLVNRSAVDTADRIAREVIARGYTYTGAVPPPNPDLAISLMNFGIRGQPHDNDPSVVWAFPESEADYPSLYFNSADPVVYNPGYYFDNTGAHFTATRVGHGPWMRSGITAVQTWIAAFRAEYDSFNISGVHAARPSRIILDQEMPIDASFYNDGHVGSINNWPNLYSYWQGIKNDPRFGWDPANPPSPLPPTPPAVPGGTQTLWQLWHDAGEPQPLADVDTTTLGHAYDWNYIGGDSRNHAWYVWWRGIESRALAGALKESIIAPLAAAWPGMKGSEYNLTLKTNGLVSKDYLGTYSNGLVYPYDIDMTGCVNNVHSYSDGAAWIWQAFRVKTDLVGPGAGYTTTERWKNTKDNATPMYGLTSNGFGSPRIFNGDGVHAPDTRSMDGDEFWEESSLRLNRYELDLCLQKNAGTTVGADPALPITTWITLPSQTMFSSGTNYYDGQYIPQGAFMGRESVYATYRTLAMARTRGVNEFIVWSDTGLDADAPGTTYNGEGSYNLGVHPDYAANWNNLRSAVSQVYDYNVLSVAAGTGTLSVPSGTTATACVRLADEGIPGETLGSRSAAVTSTVGAGCSAVLTFQRTRVNDPAPQYLNFEIEAIPTYVTGGRPPSANTISVSFYNFSTASYQTINSVAAVKDQDARLWPVSVPPQQKSRLRIRIPYQAAFLNATTKQCKIQLSLTAVAGYSQRLYIDSAICYGSDDHFRLRGDLNGDGVYDSNDLNMFNFLRNPPVNTDTGKLFGRMLVDLNNDGAYDASDDALWQAMTGNGDLSGTSVGRLPFDDYRQIGNDPRTPPARPIP